MNCHSVQNKILALPDPRQVPEPLRAHIAACPGCQMWAEQAARLESLLERLPAPVSTDRKAATIADLTCEPPIIARPLIPVHEPFAAPLVKLLQRNVKLVASLAAAVLVVLGGWWMLANKKPNPQDFAATTPEYPFLKKVTEDGIVALAKANSPADKMKSLGMLADEISSEARKLAPAASADELKDVARMFDRVVKDGMVKQANKIPLHAMSPADRKKEFSELAAKLGATATEMEKTFDAVSPTVKPALQQIVDTARDGEKKFRTLAGEI